MERNRAQEEEIRNLKLEQESQAILVCEVTKQKKRAMEDKTLLEEDKRILTHRLEEKSEELSKISNQQLDTLSDMISSSWIKCQRNKDINTEVAKWTIAEWIEKRKGICK